MSGPAAQNPKILRSLQYAKNRALPNVVFATRGRPTQLQEQPKRQAEVIGRPGRSFRIGSDGGAHVCCRCDEHGLEAKHLRAELVLRR